jgi:hypothetical protein
MGKATFWQRMSIDARRFDAAEFAASVSFFEDKITSAAAAKLIAKPDSSFESRPDDMRFGALDLRRATGVLSAIFEHSLRQPDGSRSESCLYAIYRPFAIPTAGCPNPYEYRAK